MADVAGLVIEKKEEANKLRPAKEYAADRAFEAEKDMDDDPNVMDNTRLDIWMLKPKLKWPQQAMG